MGLIKKAIAIGGIYYVAKKVHESHKETQQNSCAQQQNNTPYPQQQQNNAPYPQQPQQQHQQPMTRSIPTGHQSYCNGQCGGQCSFNASEQYGYEAAKAPVYEEKSLALA